MCTQFYLLTCFSCITFHSVKTHVNRNRHMSGCSDGKQPQLKTTLLKKCSLVHYCLLPPGCTGSRSTPWPTSCSCKPPPASRALSRPSARAARTGRKTRRKISRERGRRRERIITRWGGVTCILHSFSGAPSPPGRLYYFGLDWGK